MTAGIVSPNKNESGSKKRIQFLPPGVAKPISSGLVGRRCRAAVSFVEYDSPWI
jgi:hypothetical protein